MGVHHAIINIIAYFQDDMNEFPHKTSIVCLDGTICICLLDT